jgi:hypothetical protein
MYGMSAETLFRHRGNDVSQEEFIEMLDEKVGGRYFSMWCASISGLKISDEQLEAVMPYIELNNRMLWLWNEVVSFEKDEQDGVPNYVVKYGLQCAQLLWRDTLDARDKIRRKLEAMLSPDAPEHKMLAVTDDGMYGLCWWQLAGPRYNLNGLPGPNELLEFDGLYLPEPHGYRTRLHKSWAVRQAAGQVPDSAPWQSFDHASCAKVVGKNQAGINGSIGAYVTMVLPDGVPDEVFDLLAKETAAILAVDDIQEQLPDLQYVECILAHAECWPGAQL